MNFGGCECNKRKNSKIYKIRSFEDDRNKI